MKEADALRAISEYLAVQMKMGRGIWWRVNNIGVWDGKRYRKPASPLAYKGISDIHGLHNGRFYAIEVKSSTGRETKEQKQFGEGVYAAGGVFVLARSVDDVKFIFD